MAAFLSGESFRADAPGTTARRRYSDAYGTQARRRHSIPIAGNRTAQVAKARVGRQWGDHNRNVDRLIIGDNA